MCADTGNIWSRYYISELWNAAFGTKLKWCFWQAMMGWSLSLSHPGGVSLWAVFLHPASVWVYLHITERGCRAEVARHLEEVGWTFGSLLEPSAAHQHSLCKTAAGGSGCGEWQGQVLAWALPVATPPAKAARRSLWTLNKLSTGPHVNESSLEAVINYRAAPAPEAGKRLAGLPLGQQGWMCCSDSGSVGVPFLGQSSHGCSSWTSIVRSGKPFLSSLCWKYQPWCKVLSASVPEFLMATVLMTSLAQLGSPFCPHHPQLSSGFLVRICLNRPLFLPRMWIQTSKKTLSWAPGALWGQTPLLTLSSPCAGLLGWCQQRSSKQVKVPQTNISHSLCTPCTGVKTNPGPFCLNFVDLRYCSTAATGFSVEKVLTFFSNHFKMSFWKSNQERRPANPQFKPIKRPDNVTFSWDET